MKTNFITHTDGSGLWSDHQARTIRITGIRLNYFDGDEPAAAPSHRTARNSSTAS
jgi:hypothetical protein